MTWLVIGVLAVLVVVFAIDDDHWRKRADLFEQAYWESHNHLTELLDATDRYMEAEDSAVIRVWASLN